MARRQVAIPGRPLLAAGPARHVIGRLGSGVLVLLAISALVFFGVAVLPGDAATAVLGVDATPGSLARLRAEMGLDQPLGRRYLDWLGGVLQGDLGRSLTSGRPVTESLMPALANTFVLAAVAGSGIVVLAFLIGAYTGLRPESAADRSASFLTLFLVAVPDFVIGLVLILLVASTVIDLPLTSMFPMGDSPLDHPGALVLPALTLVLANIGYSARMIRAGVAEAGRRDFVEMAMLNGLDTRTVRTRYIVRNALAPGIQVVSLTLLFLLGGVIVVETLLQYPGIGQHAVQATIVRDFPTVTGLSVVVAAVYVVVNFLTDLAIVLVTPRLRTAGI